MNLGTYRCKAHRKTGDQCKRRPIKGGVVCTSHGGRAPQVKAAADARLRELASSAVDVLEALLEDEASAIRLATAKDILDRGGYKATERVDVTSKGESFSFDFLERKQRDAGNR